MYYAVNLADYITHGAGDFGLTLLLKPVLSETIVETDKAALDHGSALLLNCDGERGAAIVELVRKKYPRRGSPRYLRLYQSKTGKGGWKQV